MITIEDLVARGFVHDISNLWQLRRSNVCIEALTTGTYVRTTSFVVSMLDSQGLPRTRAKIVQVLDAEDLDAWLSLLGFTIPREVVAARSVVV